MGRSPGWNVRLADSSNQQISYVRERGGGEQLKKEKERERERNLPYKLISQQLSYISPRERKRERKREKQRETRKKERKKKRKKDR